MKAFSFLKSILLGLILLAAIVLTACSPKTVRTLTLAYVEGSVSVANGVPPAPVAASRGQKLAIGDEIAADPDGLAIIQLEDGTLLVVTGGASVTISQLDGTAQIPVSRFYLHNGSTFTFHQGKLPAGASYAIETPLDLASIQGSSMSVSYDPILGDKMSCLEGDCGFQDVKDKLIRRIPITAPGWIDHNDSGISQPAPMDPALQHEWEFIIGKLKDAGLADPSLLANVCHCSSAGSLMCPGQPEVPKADECASCTCGLAGTVNAANLYCSNGKTFPQAPSCVAALSCRCISSEIRVCQSTSSDLKYTSSIDVYDDPACKGVTCSCVGSKGQDYKCSDGSLWPNSKFCETWKCEGINMVSNTGTVVPSHPGCIAVCGCVGTTLKCYGPDYSYPSWPTCGGPTPTPTSAPEPTKKPRCQPSPNNPCP